MIKTGFYNKLIKFNRNITSHKTKYFEVKKTLNSLITKNYNFFLGRVYFTRNDGSKNTFVYQPTLHMLELKKDKGADYILNWVLLNRAPSSTQLHPPPPNSFQPPLSSLQHLQQYLNQNIARNWTISPNLGKKIKSCPFWLKIGTHVILEVLIPNQDLHF